MLRVKALGPCTITGFRTLLRGDVCDVPDERQEQVERLRIVGRVELLFDSPAPVAAEPSGNDAPTDAGGSSPAPAALTSEELAELAALEAELDAPQVPVAPPVAPPPPKRPPFVCVCGKIAAEHVSGKTPVNGDACGGLKKNMKRAEAPAP